MIFGTAYDTTMGSVVIVKPIQHAIEKAIIASELKSVTLNLKADGDYKPLFVTGALQSDTEIPLFTHPITILNSKGEKYICTDLRLFIRQGAEIKDIDSAVKNRVEYNFVKSRAILNMLWLNGHVNEMRINLAFGATVYAAWLAETIAKTFALDFGDQTTLSVISHAFYQSLFIEKKELSPSDIDKIATSIIKITKLPATTVFGILEQIKELKDINDYCKAVTDILANVRLQNFNLPVLLSIVPNSWYGTNNKEVIAAALEHPPTWLAMIYTALSERTYKTSKIYQLAEKYGKRGGSSDFELAYVRMVKETTQEQPTGLAIRNFE